MSLRTITLTTDFGIDDPYVGQLKGAILKRNYSVRIIDITHGIPPQDILAGSVVLRTSYHHFPEQTIHMAVIDPGVGSQRAILAAASKQHFFIAPDNGLLTLLFMDNKIQQLHRVNNTALLPTEVSSTFHGRDIMAPVAAALAAGMPLDKVGSRVAPAECVHLNLPQPQIDANRITGQVLHVDHFGNVRTSITNHTLAEVELSRFAGIELNGHRIKKILATYSEGQPGELIAVIDSSGYLEIAVNRGNAARILDCYPGNQVILHLGQQEKKPDTL